MPGEDLVQLLEVHELDVAGVGSEAGLLGSDQCHLASGPQEVEVLSHQGAGLEGSSEELRFPGGQCNAELNEGLSPRIWGALGHIVH